MGKNKKETQKVTIDDKEYEVDKLSDEQRLIINHVSDLDRKISSSQFNIDQLNVGRNAFMSLLTEALKAEDIEAA